VAIIGLLPDTGASPNARDKDGKTPRLERVAITLCKSSIYDSLYYSSLLNIIYEFPVQNLQSAAILFTISWK
jgi:hypothetical protein